VHQLEIKVLYLRVNFFGTGPSSYKKGIYRAAVSQRLRNTNLGERLYIYIYIYNILFFHVSLFWLKMCAARRSMTRIPVGCSRASGVLLSENGCKSPTRISRSSLPLLSSCGIIHHYSICHF